jgi:hypothetical protein
MRGRQGRIGKGCGNKDWQKQAQHSEPYAGRGRERKNCWRDYWSSSLIFRGTYS